MYFEIYRHGKLIKRGKEILDTLNWSVELMDVPELDLTIPATYMEYVSGREEVKVYTGDKIFYGIVYDIQVDKTYEVITLSLHHVIEEWNYRQISVNNAVKDKNLNVIFKKDQSGTPSTEASVIDQIEDIYEDANFAYPSWDIEFQGGAGDRTIDYVYSKQTKLEALTKTCELTDDLFWRVDFSGKKVVQVGTFGKKQPYVLSSKRAGKSNLPILKEPTIDYEFDSVVNLATVYSEKSDSGMSSLTLREVYNDPSLQKDGFPVVILRDGANNERNYSKYGVQFQNPKIAPNNQLEFAVIDEESIALEGGVVIEGAYAFNDLGAFNIDGKTINNNDRIKASKTAYHSVIKKLKQARRSHKVEVQTGEIPSSVKVGDKIRFLYDNSIWNLDACSNYMKKILTSSDERFSGWFYITMIEYEITPSGNETTTLQLEKYIKVERETSNT